MEVCTGSSVPTDNMPFKLEDQWPELTALLFLALGFIISVLLQNAFLSYVSIVLSGALAGRIYYMKRFKEPILPFVLIILGFFLGYLLGAFWVNRSLTVVLFLISFGVSYYLHLKKIVTTFKSERFIR